MRIKRSASLTDFQQMTKAEEHARLSRIWVRDRMDKFLPLKFLTVDRAIMPAALNARQPTSRPDQAVEVNSGHTFHSKQYRVGGNKSIYLKVERLIRIGIVERIEVVDVQLIGTPGSVDIGFVGDQSAIGLDMIDYFFNLYFRQNATQGIQSNPIV